MKDFKNKKCFITGAASGIGRSTAIAVSGHGAQLFLTDINEVMLAETVDLIKKNGGNIGAWKRLDVSNYDEVKNFADQIHDKFGPMDILMNIAGIAVWGAVEQLRISDWQRVININLMGPINVINCLIPPMVMARRGGHLVNVSSAAGLIALPLHAPYSASKFGLRGLSEVLRYDMMRHDIGVTVICPGAVETPLKHSVEIVGVDRDNEETKKLTKRFSDRAVSPEKVASLIINAVLKNKYLVFTSIDIWAVYWCKRKLFFMYHIIMKQLNRMAEKILLIAGKK
jgi:NAD(P)-dependent dehydrogenase (short-subunit alcohol dehydrogenase family)